MNAIKIIENPACVDTVTERRRRTWRERLFTWPWRPLKDIEVKIKEVPSRKLTWTSANVVVCHPERAIELRRELGTGEEGPASLPQQDDEPEIVAAEVEPGRDDTQQDDDDPKHPEEYSAKWDIKTLLSELDEVFAGFKFKNFSLTTAPETRAALNSLGPTILPPDNEWVQCPRILDTDGLPAIMFMANPMGRHTKAEDQNDDTQSIPYAFYAVKLNVLPHHCQPMKGAYYEVGFIHEWDKGRREWVSGFVAIDKDTGWVKFPKVRYSKVAIINRHRNHHALVWDDQTLVMASGNNDTSIEEKRTGCANAVGIMFNLWAARKDYWKVSVRKDKRRATFLIHKEQTKHFFKDRGVTTTTKTGQKKRIIHYVSPHLRLVGGKKSHIEGHVRGLRTFEWQGYACAVTAPDHHKFSTDEFTAPSHSMDDPSLPAEKFMSGKTAMEHLSKFEDTGGASW